MSDSIKFHRVQNDSNGNGRLAVHFFAFITDEDRKAMAEQYNADGIRQVLELQGLAIARAAQIGGKRYRGKDFGGGIVFTNYESNLRTVANKPEAVDSFEFLDANPATVNYAPRPIWQVERDRLLAHAEHQAKKGNHYRACLLMIKAWAK